jgi:hypothetical protein
MVARNEIHGGTLMAQKTHVAAYLDEATIARIDGWADKLGVSRSKMVGMLAKACVEDDGWMLDIVTSKAGLKVSAFLESVGLLKPQQETPAVPPGTVKAAG